MYRGNFLSAILHELVVMSRRERTVSKSSAGQQVTARIFGTQWRDTPTPYLELWGEHFYCIVCAQQEHESRKLSAKLGDRLTVGQRPLKP